MSARLFLGGKVELRPGDAREVMRGMPDASVDSVVTDPPYALVSIVKRFGKPGSAPAQEGTDGRYARASAGFMGQQWDTGETAFAVEFWAEVFRVLKPGGHVVAFGGTRTYHRLAVAIEDAGFEIRDQIQWLYGSGFPKSHDVSKGLDRMAGAEREVIAQGRAVKRMIPGADQNKAGWEKNNGREFVPTETAPATDAARQWQGWGTALKPACEPIVLARKPLIGTVAANVLAFGTGALNIDGCRIAGEVPSVPQPAFNSPTGKIYGMKTGEGRNGQMSSAPLGRWPANIVHDGSEEVVGAFPQSVSPSPHVRASGSDTKNDIYGSGLGEGRDGTLKGNFGDSGSAARFFYTAKADSDDRIGSKHPTVKPVDLMQWLVRLVTPRGGLVLDPFAGTGTTGEAAWREGMRAILIEREEAYQADIARRMDYALAGPDERSHAIVKAKGKVEDPGPLFAAVKDAAE